MVLSCIICGIGVASFLFSMLLFKVSENLLDESRELLLEAKKKREEIGILLKEKPSDAFIAKFTYINN